MDTFSTYLPILLQLLLAITFVAITLFLTHVLGPRVLTKKKLKSFECGIKSIGDARQPFAVHYFLTAILFVLFDVEIIFFYPWAINFRELGTVGLISMGLFIALLLVGFWYILRKQALEWE
ncbi:MAG: NADH-quinone oxidoreductase subunit A [Chitinophagales bacterium]|nr:NADH-quinone oxidoreductase subunit A [Chitinophagales bacterium]MDW8428227.1 NADH-quinone oxidoreductase subunit A [Chitinophagales bacterium]